MALLHRARMRLLPLIYGFESAVRSIRLGFTIAKRGPIAGGAPGEGEGGGDEGKEAGKEESGKEESGKEGAGKEETDDQKAEREKAERVEEDDDWKTKSRKNETRAKKAEREAKETREKLAERENADKSEAEKAVEKAKAEGRKEAETEAQKERKADRLEVAVTRLASKKITLGSGDDAEEVRFADTEDAQLHIERAIARGEIDEEDIFDKEGRVNSDALQKELVDLLERKPHLKDRASEGDSKKKTADADLRKGEPVDSDLEKLTPEDHEKRKYGNGK
jgi:hypothetical protein